MKGSWSNDLELLSFSLDQTLMEYDPYEWNFEEEGR